MTRSHALPNPIERRLFSVDIDDLRGTWQQDHDRRV